MIPRPGRAWPRVPRPGLAWPRALLALSALSGLGACLKDHPLLLPGNAYDPALSLQLDSLSRFDSVEIDLADPAGESPAIPIFRGRRASAEGLEPLAAGDGRELVYMVRGWKEGRGQCFAQRVARDGAAEVLFDTCLTGADPGADPTTVVPPADSGKVKPAEPPAGRLRGRVVSARDGTPEAGWTVRMAPDPPLEAGAVRVTGEDGSFDFGLLPPGDRQLAFACGGRIGRTLRARVEDGDTASIVAAAVLPAAEFREAPLSWLRNVSAVTVAAGHVLAPSSEFQAPGAVAVFPLDNLSPSLQRYPEQGNGSAETPSEYFEAGDAVADPAAAYIAYPGSDRLGRVGGWRGASSAFNVPAGLQPSALLLEGGRLLALGRIPGGSLALGTYDTASLALLRMDTLDGHGWDGVLPLEWGPRLVSGGGGGGGNAWYAVDGNGPAVKGRLLRIDKGTRKVAARELPEAQASDLAVSGGRVIVTFAGPTARRIRIYGQDLELLDSLELGQPAYRIVVADSGRLAGYAFVATADHAVTVIGAGTRGRLEVAGRLPLGSRPRSLAVDAASASLVVTDWQKVFLAGF